MGKKKEMKYTTRYVDSIFLNIRLEKQLFYQEGILEEEKISRKNSDLKKIRRFLIGHTGYKQGKQEDNEVFTSLS